jgi:Ca2+-dependent lipid-binding protein
LCVYPNFSKITLSPDWKITEVALGFKPTAVVVVKLVSAKDLAKKSGLSGIISSIVGQNLPDPYATITFGASLFKTDVVKNTQNPIWSENGFVFLLDTPNGHKIKVDFYGAGIEIWVGWHYRKKIWPILSNFLYIYIPYFLK